VDGHEDVTTWIHALDDEFEPLLGVTYGDDDDGSNINDNDHILKTPHRDVGSSLEVVSRPTLEPDDAQQEPSITALQSTMFPKGQSSESAATHVVETVRTNQIFEGDEDWEKIEGVDAYLPVYDGSLLQRDWTDWVPDHRGGIPYKYSFEEKKWIPAESDIYKCKQGKGSLVGVERKQRKGEGKVNDVKVSVEEDEDKYSKVEEDRVIEWIRDVQDPIVNLIDDGKRLRGPPATEATNQ
jgi:hypothetical protein